MKKYKVTVNDRVIDEGLSYREACELATEIDNNPHYFRDTVDIVPMEHRIPDKIYIREYQDGDYTTWWDEKPHELKSIGMKAVCYIRKEALMEFVNKKLQESADRLDFHANKAYAEVLDKLNEM